MTPSSKIRVLLYDDNEALRLSMETLIAEEDDMEWLAAMPNAETILDDIQQFQPSVILMDIDMPVVNGVDAVKRVRKHYQDLPVIMLTVFDDNENIFQAICAGASGYLLKRYALEEVLSGIRNVLTGGAPMTGSVAKKVLALVPKAASDDQEATALSARESEILQLLAKGYSYKMIAAQIQLSIDTIRFHIKKIYEKLQVHSATEAVSKAIKEGLV